VNEARNYGDVGRAMQRYETEADWFPAMPCVGVRRRVPGAHARRTSRASRPRSGLAQKATSIGELAALICVDERLSKIRSTRFNENASAGLDPDFGRGERYYDRWIGDNGAASDPTLAALVEAPFYALEVHCGCMGTKGGPQTDGWGRVIGVGGDVIKGLYAAGNAAASPFGIATPAGGATIGPALVFGTRAGEARRGPVTEPATGPAGVPEGARFVQDLLDRETRPVPPALRACSAVDLGDVDIPRDRYLSREIHNLERDKVWRRVWQVICSRGRDPRCRRLLRRRDRRDVASDRALLA